MSAHAAKGDNLEKRLVTFSSQIIAIAEKLPSTAAGRHISNQILRSGTAVDANYGEARGAESRADFIHKLRVVLKELNETSVWLQMIAETCLLSRDFTDQVFRENRELCRIISASIKTASRGRTVN
jgi:four helix bundle protein